MMCNLYTVLESIVILLLYFLNQLGRASVFEKKKHLFSSELTAFIYYCPCLKRQIFCKRNTHGCVNSKFVWCRSNRKLNFCGKTGKSRQLGCQCFYCKLMEFLNSAILASNLASIAHIVKKCASDSFIYFFNLFHFLCWFFIFSLC